MDHEGPTAPDAPTVVDGRTTFSRAAYDQAMARLEGRRSTLDARTPEEWARLNLVLMDDGPINLGAPTETRDR